VRRTPSYQHDAILRRQESVVRFRWKVFLKSPHFEGMKAMNTDEEPDGPQWIETLTSS